MSGALVESSSLNKNKPKKRSYSKKIFLSFLNSIDSTWHGHEEFTFWLVKFIHPKTVVDLGFDRGLSTIAFSYKNRGQIFGVDWFEEDNYITKCFALDSAFRNISDGIRFSYAKNIHLIVGPFEEIAKTWTRKIDILHIDWSHTYSQTAKHFENWSRYLMDESVILFHDVVSKFDETGRFFRELKMKKFIFPHAQGLGVATKSEKIIKAIVEDWSHLGQRLS